LGASVSESLERLGFGYDMDDVQGMVFRYDMTFSGKRTWRDNIVSTNLEGGGISTALGRTLKVSNDMKVNSLYNYPVQGTAADGFKLALINLDDLLAGKDARFVHILHDEVIVEARKDIAESMAVTVKNCMEKTFKDVLPGVPFVVEPEIRDSWR
jgi:DNA polymerase-1